MSFLKGKYAVLVRRELWENRSLWLAPAIVAACLLVLPLFGRGFNINLGEGPVVIEGNLTEPALVPDMLVGQGVMVGLLVILGAVTCLVMFTYLLDCLYAERKDRSILFWKSLPVSDAETVFAKLAVALLLTPLFVLLLAMLVQPLVLGLLHLRYEAMRPAISLDSVLGGWRHMPQYALTWLYAVLWYAPLSAWLLLASVMAKRAPLLYALLPPFTLMLIEGIVFRSGHVGKFLGERLAPWAAAEWRWVADQEGGVVPGLTSPEWGRFLTDINLWGGLAVAAGMVYIVIRLRRYRDDT